MTTKYASNSDKVKSSPVEKDAQKIKSVVKGKTKVRQKSELSKVAKNIISEECGSIKDYIIYDTLIPVVKDTVANLIKGSIDMLLYGEIRSSGRSGRRTNASRVSYRDFYDDRRDDRRDSRRDRSNSRLSYDDISFESRGDAEDVLAAMDDILESYGVVRVADFFELAGKTGSYVNQDYGWTNLASAKIEMYRGDFYIKLPRPKPVR